MWQRMMVLGTAAAIAFGTTASAQQLSFRTAITDGLFSGAESVTVADVDDDGNLDLLFPTGQGGVITILYGAGDGTFDAQDTCSTGRVPVGVAVANFDGDPDKIPDIAAVDSNSRQVVVLPGMGGRQFNCDAIKASDTGITSPSAVATADFSGDGIPDLAVASGDSGGGSVAVLLGAGDGTFAATEGSPFPTGPNTRSVTVDFVNSDTLPDIIATNRDALPGTVSALINLGLGAFQPSINSTAGESPQAAATGDFDGDGMLDVVVANRGSDRFTLLKGDGTGAFTVALEVPAGIFPTAIVADDFDGDQNLDVAVANNVSYDVTVAFGNGHGAFPERRTFLSGALPAGIGSGKFNADSLADLVVLNKTGEGDAYNLLLADVGRSFQAIENLGVTGSPTAIAVGDISGDARPDAVVAAGQQLAVLIPDASGRVAVTTTELPTTINSVVLADIDRDGHSDLLLTRAGDAQNDFLGVALGNGRGGFKPLQFTPVGRGASGIAVADFNRDGLPDAVLTEGLDNTVRILLGDGLGGFTTVGDLTVRPPDATGHCSSTTARTCDFPEDCPTGEQCVFDQYFPRAAVADYLNDDGIIDLAVVNYARGDKADENALSLFFGHGDGTFDLAKVIAAGRRPLAIVASDLNNDGMLDLVTANEDQNAGLLIFKATGGGNYQAPLTLTSGANPAGLALRDVDSDGFIDTLTVDRTGERVAIRRGRTSSPFFGAQVATCPEPGCFDTGRTPVAVAAGDFNDDESYDLLVANNAGNNVSLVLNNKGRTLPVPGRGDANGDGRLSAADVTALMRTIMDPALRANNRAVEDVVRTAARLGVPATAALDADGDGIVGITDAIGIVARVFRGVVALVICG